MTPAAYPMTASDALRSDLADLCVRAECICARYGLPMSRVTLVTRHLTEPTMFVIVTNEPDTAEIVPLLTRHEAAHTTPAPEVHP